MVLTAGETLQLLKAFILVTGASSYPWEQEGAMSMEDGHVMIELMLSLLVVAMCCQLAIPLVRSEAAERKMSIDTDAMVEIWNDEERCSIFCPAKKKLPDLVSLK